MQRLCDYSASNCFAAVKNFLLIPYHDQRSTVNEQKLLDHNRRNIRCKCARFAFEAPAEESINSTSGGVDIITGSIEIRCAAWFANCVRLVSRKYINKFCASFIRNSRFYKHAAAIK